MQLIKDDNTEPIKVSLEMKNKMRSERQVILSYFVEEINKERVGTKWKPVTGRAVAIALSPIKSNFELYQFLSECRDYKNRKGSFGKRFWGGCKISK